jgi:23S rRNA A2030 N6-methylase RlmJ
MHGCGMIVVRPPYQLDAELKQIVPWLRDALVQQQPAPARVEWLVPE